MGDDSFGRRPAAKEGGGKREGGAQSWEDLGGFVTLLANRSGAGGLLPTGEPSAGTRNPLKVLCSLLSETWRP